LRTAPRLRARRAVGARQERVDLMRARSRARRLASSRSHAAASARVGCSSTIDRWS
jgi:hypothetical protein